MSVLALVEFSVMVSLLDQVRSYGGPCLTKSVVLFVSLVVEDSMIVCLLNFHVTVDYFFDVGALVGWGCSVFVDCLYSCCLSVR
jgi:hypothetical protein